MSYSRGWLFAFFIFVASSDKVSGHLLRNPTSSSNVDDFQDVTQPETDFSDQFQNHEGGIIDSPSGFLCLDVVKLFSSYSGEEKKEPISEYNCHYKTQGVIMSSKLEDINGIFDEHFQYDSRLFLKGATFEELTNTIQITPEVQFIWLTTTTEQSQTKSKIENNGSGTKTVLVFRVTNNRVPARGTSDEMSDWVFGASGDNVTPKSQYEACSFNQLKITPALGRNVINGVVQVFISVNTNDYLEMQNAAKLYAENELGVPVDSYDFLMFALPEGATDGGSPVVWTGKAEMYGKHSAYSEIGDTSFNWIVSDEITMRQIGSNIGLWNSGDGRDDHGDRTCAMGGSLDMWDRSICFNAAKMTQLGWYKSREKLIDPVRQNFSGKIIGVNDYGNSTSNHTLVLEIKNTGHGGNLYLTWNKAEGINNDTGEYVDQIVVVQAPVDKSQGSPALKASSVLKTISVGNSTTVANFFEFRDLTISFVSIGSDGDVDYANVDIQLGTEHVEIS